MLVARINNYNSFITPKYAFLAGNNRNQGLKCDTVCFGVKGRELKGNDLIEKIETVINTYPEDLPEEKEATYAAKHEVLSKILDGTEKWEGLRSRVEKKPEYSNKDLARGLGLKDKQYPAWMSFINDTNQELGHSYFTGSLGMPILKALGLEHRKDLIKAFSKGGNYHLIGEKLLERLKQIRNSKAGERSSVYAAKKSLMEYIIKFTELKIVDNPKYTNQNLMKDLGLRPDQSTNWKLFITISKHQNNDPYYTRSLGMPILKALKLEHREDLKNFSREQDHLTGEKLLDRLLQLKDCKVKKKDSDYNAKISLLEPIIEFVDQKIEKENPLYGNKNFMEEFGFNDEQRQDWMSFISLSNHKKGDFYCTDNLVPQIQKTLKEKLPEKPEELEETETKVETPALKVINVEKYDLPCEKPLEKPVLKIIDEKRKPLAGQKLLNTLLKLKKCGIDEENPVFKAKRSLLEYIIEFTESKLKDNPDYGYKDLMKDLGLNDEQHNEWRGFLTIAFHERNKSYYTEELGMPILKKLGLEHIGALKAFAVGKNHLTGKNLLNTLLKLKDSKAYEEDRVYKAKKSLLEYIIKLVELRIEEKPKYNNQDLMKDLRLTDAQHKKWKNFLDISLHENGHPSYTEQLIKPILTAMDLQDEKGLKVYSAEQNDLYGEKLLNTLRQLNDSKVKKGDPAQINLKQTLVKHILELAESKVEENPKYGDQDLMIELGLKYHNYLEWRNFIDITKHKNGNHDYKKNFIMPMMQSLNLLGRREVKKINPGYLYTKSAVF